LHRSPELTRQERNQQIFRIDVSLDAKAAADVESDATDARLRKLQHGRRLAPHPVHDLRGRPDCHRIGARLMQADHAAAFHGRGDIAMMMKASLQSMR
jgi:hypothetical protein